MGLNKRLISSEVAGASLGNPTDHFDILVYEGTSSTYNTANGVEASVTLNANSASYALASTSLNTGKWYWEVELLSSTYGSGSTLMVGTINSAFVESWANANTKMYYAANGDKYTGGSGTGYGATFTIGDIISVLYDGDNRTLTFWKNGSSQGTAFTGLRTDWPNNIPAIGTGSYSETAKIIFDSNDFTYTMPSGYSALSSTTTMSVSGGSVQSARAAQPIDFQPDFVWIKRYDASENYVVYDSIRGVNNSLDTTAQSAEADWSTYDSLKSFNSNGITLGTDSTQRVNYNGAGYVAWCLKAGGTATTGSGTDLTNISISANVPAGFSIVTYSGGSTATAKYAHGLNSAPELVIIKARNQSTRNWIWHWSAFGAGGYVMTNSPSGANAVAYSTAIIDNTDSTYVNIGNSANVNGSGNTFVAYNFHSVSGFSKIGTYVGNGSTSNAVTGLGFEPRFIIIKRKDFADQWTLHDAGRSPSDPRTKMLLINGTGAQFNSSSYSMNFDSDGFTLLANYTAFNASGSTYVYIAIA